MEPTYWLSQLPNENKNLMDAFIKVSVLVKSIRNDDYDPHVTLFNYCKDTIDIRSFLEIKVHIEDQFELAIGASDTAGQLKNIIYTYSKR